MNVSLTPQLESFVAEAVQSGRYGSASQAVREGLRLLEEREARFQRLKRDIDDGLASGRHQEGTFAEMAREFRAEWETERATPKPALS